MAKEMVGGCCVCLDETGWPDNALVYCDGAGCTVAVHQACYGIINVPDGSWFCKRCESQERQVRLKCELCPSKDGALKRTDNSGWAHIVCALYIPEVKFGNNTTMEPIRISEVPYERYQKSCYICEDKGDSMNAKGKGACISCHYPSCRRSFHVTCAQSTRLLCEQETGSERLDYFGYCEHHINLQQNRTYNTSPAEVPDRSGSANSNTSSVTSSELRVPVPGAEVRPVVTDITQQKLKKDKLRDNPKGRARSVAHRSRGRHHRAKSQSKGQGFYPEVTAEITSALSTENATTPHKKRMTISSMLAGDESLPTFSDTLNSTNKVQKPTKEKLPSKKRPFPHKFPSKKMKSFNLDGMTDENETGSPASPPSPSSYSEGRIETNYKSPSASCSPLHFETESDLKPDEELSEDSDNLYKADNKSLEPLINKSWEADTDMLLGYISSHGDIASLLSVIYLIKSDNVAMKTRIDDLTKKRDYLRAVNEGLKNTLSKDAGEFVAPDKSKFPPLPDVSTDPIKLQLSLDQVHKVEKVISKIAMSSDL